MKIGDKVKILKSGYTESRCINGLKGVIVEKENISVKENLFSIRIGEHSFKWVNLFDSEFQIIPNFHIEYGI